MNHLTFDLSSGLELRVVCSRPGLGSMLCSMLSVEPILQYQNKNEKRKLARNKSHEDMKHLYTEIYKILLRGIRED